MNGPLVQAASHPGALFEIPRERGWEDDRRKLTGESLAARRAASQPAP